MQKCEFEKETCTSVASSAQDQQISVINAEKIWFTHKF